MKHKNIHTANIFYQKINGEKQFMRVEIKVYKMKRFLNVMF